MANYLAPIYIPVDAIARVSLFTVCVWPNVVFQPTYGRVLFTSYHCEDW